jgi:hypothetical protein
MGFINRKAVIQDRKTEKCARVRQSLLERLEPRMLMSVSAAHGYAVTTFANAPAGASQPDSIVTDGNNVYVGYQNHGAPDGSGGAESTIAQYSAAGTLLNTWTVTGHNDGLKVDPSTHLLWAMQNEDATPNLVIIDPIANTQTAYTFAAAPLAGGGYDDITFVGGKVFFSASNPANNPNTKPAIVEATLSGTTVNVSTVLLGNALATNTKHKQVTLNLQDPDSMTSDPAGDLVMTSQADDELVIVKNPGAANQSVSVVPLSDAKKKAVSVDDSLFPPTGSGEILVTDTTAGTIYAVTASSLKNIMISAGTDIGELGSVDLKTGRFTPVVSGLQGPHGLAFLPFGVTAAKGFAVKPFISSPVGSSQPDSLAVDGSNVFVGYQNGGAPDGSGGATSTIVQYTSSGAVVKSWTVAGHNDGLKVDPSTHLVWSMQNEDANPNLVIIDPTSGTQTPYTFAAAPLAGGGYDDITFVGGKVFFSASNPANNPNTKPAIVEATLSGTTVNVSTVLLGNAAATDSKHKQVTLNLQDPDSMTSDPAGDLVMTSQADDELVIVKNPGAANQSVSVVSLSDAKKKAVSVDDSLFVSGKGQILLSDTKAGIVYSITGTGVKSKLLVSAAPDIGELGTLDLKTGRFTPIITGFGSPHGLALL